MSSKVGMELTRLRVVVLILLALSATSFLLHYHTRPVIAVIRVEGSIEDFYAYPDLAKQAMRDDKIKAVVLVVDSYGGTVDACFQAEQSFRELNARKPVVVSMGQYATSGAYLISSASSYIYAYEYTTTGGLGVIAVWVSYENYLAKEGIKYYVWKSGEMKDIGAPWRGPTEEENRKLQELVDEYMEKLLRIIDNNRRRDNRPLLKNLDELKKGEVYYGEDAIAYGLVDELGDFKDAERKAATLSGLKEGEYRVVELKPRTRPAS